MGLDRLFGFLLVYMLVVPARAEVVPAHFSAPDVAAAPVQAPTCEQIVDSPQCSEFRLRRTDLQGQFLRCDQRNPGASSTPVACAKGVWGAVKEYAAIFEKPELNATGQAFHGMMRECFANTECRESTVRAGLNGRELTENDRNQLAKVPPENFLRVQPFYYGILERLKAMKAKELDLAARGISAHAPNFEKAMRESFPGWKPEQRAIYIGETWSESASKATSAISARLKELGVELQCLDEATVTEMLCFGAGLVVDPLIALKGITALPRAAKVMSRLMRSSGELKSAAVLKLEAKWGRALTAEEAQLVDQAHRIGVLEKGKDGSDAGIGNYTVSQLRRKYDVLQGRFTPEQIRDLMETGAVGLTPAEQTALRAQQASRADAPLPNRRLAQDPTNAEQVFERFDESMSATRKIRAQLDEVEPRLTMQTDYQKLREQMASLERRQKELVDSWQMGNVEHTRDRARQLESIEARIERARLETETWVTRARNRDWAPVLENPQNIMPQQVYKVRTNAGDELRLSFNDRVANDMAWSTADVTRERAMRATLQSLQVGSEKGLKLMPIDKVQIYKVQIKGGAVGAYRVYGMEKNGILRFVHWEHEGVHDAKYLQRVKDRVLAAMREYD